MPDYIITDPNTGKKLKLTGDSPPTEDELTQMFASAEVQGPSTNRRPNIAADIGGSALSMISSAVAEPVAGIAGLLSTPFGSEQATDNINTVRDALTFTPERTGSQKVTEKIGRGGELLTKGLRSPVAGVVGIGEAIKEGSLSAGADKIDAIMNDGIGATAGSELASIGAPPAVSAATEVIPLAIASLFGLRGSGKTAPRTLKATDELKVVLQRKGVDPTDASPANIARVEKVVDELTGAQAERIASLEKVGIKNPTKAQKTRNANDFQKQQESAKTQTEVRDALELQESALSQTFDDAVTGTGGKPVTSGSTIVDEVVGRSTKLDTEISNLYKAARERSGDQPNVDLTRFANKVLDNLDSDGATDGLYSAMKGELRRRGVIDAEGKVIGQVDVAAAEEIRKFANAQFDPKGKSFANSEIRNLKNSLDDDVFSSAGKDLFAEARRAKSEFETSLSNAKISKFDKNNRSLVRDILENKIDPDSLVERITSSKSYRASDLRQLKDYLTQSEGGTAAFNDLRAQAMQSIRDKSFFGPEDAQGIQALSRSKLESAISKIGDERLKVLFTAEERTLLNDVLRASKIREPVRGTALGRGPSAQAIDSINRRLDKIPVIGDLVESIQLSRQGKVVLNGSATPPRAVIQSSAQGLLVPLAVGGE